MANSLPAEQAGMWQIKNNQKNIYEKYFSTYRFFKSGESCH